MWGLSYLVRIQHQPIVADNDNWRQRDIKTRESQQRYKVWFSNRTKHLPLPPLEKLFSLSAARKLLFGPIFFILSLTPLSLVIFFFWYLIDHMGKDWKKNCCLVSWTPVACLQEVVVVQELGSLLKLTIVLPPWNKLAYVCTYLGRGKHNKAWQISK